MKLCFLGNSHAPQTLAGAAQARGWTLTGAEDAELIFLSEDTPTNEKGERDLSKIDYLMSIARRDVPFVLTSQVPPGYTRKWSMHPQLFYLAETLRIKDAAVRAMYPEQFILGVRDTNEYVLPLPLCTYLLSHGCALNVMTYEEAEFAKIAINLFLAAQVDITNKLSAGAAKVGARWEPIAEALRCDKRIGRHAYLTPGRWQESLHLLRDHVTLEALLAR